MTKIYQVHPLSFGLKISIINFIRYFLLPTIMVLFVIAHGESTYLWTEESP